MTPPTKLTQRIMGTAEAPINLPARRRHSASEDSMDISTPNETTAPLLGNQEDDMEDDDISQSHKQSAWKKLSSKRPWHRSRRRPSASGREFDVENIICGRTRKRKCLKCVGGFLIALGIFQLILLVGNLVILLVPDRLHEILHSWGKLGHIGAGLAHWPTDFSRDIQPKPCHSHNDYWRRVPFYSAIEAGCVGVEADIWLFREELYVGHSIASLTPNRTLNNLYINPLLDVLSKQNPEPQVLPDPEHHLNGVYDTTPEQTLIFLIDFKTAGAALFPYVVKALEPLRAKGYLSHMNGTEWVKRPITVVGTGNTPFDMVKSNTSNPHQDIFFDAPLDKMYSAATDEEDLTPPSELPNPVNTTFEYNASNSYYASVSFADTIGRLRGGQFSKEQLQKVRSLIKGAHERGLKARFWDTPYWPISLRNHVWTVLVKQGMDILNVDDLKGATKENWEKPRHWW